jgi:AcrR family transcriptional regulator
MPGQKAAEASRREQILRAAFDIAASGGLGALTIRAIAARARLSSGLVLFHFTTKAQLLLALLDWLLATTTVLRVTPDIEAIASPLERLIALLQREMNRLSSEPRRIRVFFEFWMLGVRRAPIRVRMRAELDRYRTAFRPMAEAVLRAEPSRFTGVTPDALSAVAVSFIKGCAVQSMMDPNFDIDAYLRATQQLINDSWGGTG